MPFNTDSLHPTGGMNKDIDKSMVPKGDYLDALNITHITEEGSTGYAIQNTKGNLFRFEIPATTAQNKVYLINLGDDNITNHTIDFFWTDGSAMASATFTEGANIAATAANAQAAITAALAGATVPQTATYGVIGSTMTIEVDTVDYYEYTITSDAFTDPMVIQEARDKSLEGEANIIGSFDLLGDLFIWSTPQVNMPSTFSGAITGATNATPIEITSGSTQYLQTGQSVVISGVLGNTAANGTWIINITGASTFELLNSVGSGAYTSGGDITINSDGVGEVGVATYDADTDAFTYYTLLKTKEFNFRRPKQIDTYCEENNFQRSLYWTDDYNIPRVMYYRGAYMLDGAITYVNSDGIYEYGTIGDETKLIITNEDIGFTFTGQDQGGGAIQSGNWRYSIRLLTEQFSATNWTELSNPINVFAADTGGVATLICGDDPGITTGKINNFSLSNLPVDVFSYVELAGVNYVGNAIVGSVLKRQAITSPDMSISHTGTESTVTNLDVSTLNQFSFEIRTAKNIDAIDNRLILSNLTTSQEIDFSAFALTIEHSLLQKSLGSIGLATATPNTSKLGEFQDPINVYNYVGYMIHDTYRMGVRFRLKSDGNFTKVFYVDDIRIDTSATNVTTPDRRVAGLPNYNLTSTGTDPDVYVPYIQFSNIDLDYLIDGVPLRDLVTSIHFERVERVKEVLTSGVLAMSITGVNAGIGYGPAGAYRGENPYITGFNGVQAGYPTGAFAADRKVAKLYSPDIHCGQRALTFVAGDVIKHMGNPEVEQYANWPLGGALTSDTAEYNGFFTTALVSDVITSGTQAIDHASPFVLPVSGSTYSQELGGGGGAFWQIRSGFVIETTNNLVTGGANPDYGVYNAYYFREIPYTDPSDPSSCKYGNPAESVYIPTGAVLSVDASTSSPATQDVYGGDVFTQKTYLMHRAGGSVAPSIGAGGGIAYYAQNVVNVQMMKKYNNGADAWEYPNQVPADTWLLSTNMGTPIAPYNKGYNIKNEISRDVAFDATLPDQSDLPTQIRYSELKPQNSVIDNFRVFLPLNYKDLPLSWGEIMHHANYNGELFTWQPRMVQRQYFNTRGTMEVGGGANTSVLIGDGSVFSRDGQMITNIGTFHKWSVIKGRSAQGNDVMYWINTELKKAMRLGYDGSIKISDIQGMQSFFANNLTWVMDNDTPADGEGIFGVWDERYLSAIWTVRAKRIVDPYTGADSLPVMSFTPTINLTVTGATNAGPIEITTSVPHTLMTGTHIRILGVTGNTGANGYWNITVTGASTFTLDSSVGTGTYISGGTITGWASFEETGEIYENITDPYVEGNLQQPDIRPNYWRVIPHTNNEYYNEYTIEYNEQKNKFTTYYTFKPKIYLKWTDTFLTPRPISDTGYVYEHRLGDECVWYDEQIENGHITLIFNQNINTAKRYLALWAASQIIPKRVEFLTKSQETFIVDSDFENLNGFFAGPIKNDILTSSDGASNDEDTTQLYGQYIEIKVVFEAQVYQKLVDCVLKFYSQNRLPNR